MTEQLERQLEAHGLLLVLLVWAVAFALVLTVAAILELRAMRRERSYARRRAAIDDRLRRNGLAEGFERGWHG